MLARWAGCIVKWQIGRGILKKEEQALYEYAYELLLNQGINIAAAVAIAVIFKTPLTVFAFLAAYIPLRSYAGGYHADTNLNCTIVSALMLCAACITVNRVVSSDLYLWWLPSFAVSGGLIFRYAPVADKNKPLDEEETIRYRKKSRILWAAETLLGVLLCVLHEKAGIALAFTHMTLSFILCLGILKNGSVR